MPDLAEAASTGDRRATLVALRDLLAADLQPTEHQPGCGCECGPPPNDARALAALSRELRAVLLEIEKLPSGEEESPLDRIAAVVQAELAARHDRESDAAAA